MFRLHNTYMIRKKKERTPAKIRKEMPNQTKLYFIVKSIFFFFICHVVLFVFAFYYIFPVFNEKQKKKINNMSFGCEFELIILL
jgi:hypothetical protein